MPSCHRHRTSNDAHTRYYSKYECNASLGHDQYFNFPSGDQIIRRCDPCTYVPGCSTPDRSEAVYIAYCTTTVRTYLKCMYVYSTVSAAGSCALWYVLYTSLSGNVNNSHSLTRISKRLSYFRTDRYTRENMHALPAFYHSTEFGLTEAALATTCTTWRRMQRTRWKNGPRAEIELISSCWPTADPEAFPSATKSTTGCHAQSPNPAGQ